MATGTDTGSRIAAKLKKFQMELPDASSLDSILLDDILSNPALVGFLECFAAKQFCDENIRFFHRVGWWINQYETKSEEDICTEANAIFEIFVDTGSMTEISLSSEARQSVLVALETMPPLIDSFNVALKESYSTIDMDLFPRFKASADFASLKRLLSIKRTADDIFSHFHKIGILPDTLFNREGFSLQQIDFKNVTLDEVLEDKYMTRVFTAFLAKKHAAENTMCYQSIQGFKRNYATTNKNGPIAQFSTPQKIEQTRETAWLIYVAFIMNGAEYEVSTSMGCRKSIAFHVGNPACNMFAEVEQRCYEQQVTLFSEFRLSDEYNSLEHVMVEAKKGLGKPSPRSTVCTVQ